MVVLRLYNPITSEWLKTPPERVELAEERAELAEERAEQEFTARQHAEKRVENAEAALAKALEELERLKAERDK